jgi:hypothetical protein
MRLEQPCCLTGCCCGRCQVPLWAGAELYRRAVGNNTRFPSLFDTVTGLGLGQRDKQLVTYFNRCITKPPPVQVKG